MACIGEKKQTKDLIRKNGIFSANLASELLLPLADYYGCTYGRTTPDKMERLPTVEWGEVLDVPTIAESPVSFELEVKFENKFSNLADARRNASHSAKTWLIPKNEQHSKFNVCL